MRGQSPIGVGFVFGCDGCGDLHLFGVDAVSPIEVLAGWGWKMGGWGDDLCPTCVEEQRDVPRISKENLR